MIRFGAMLMTASTGNAKLTPELRPVPSRVKEDTLMPTSRALLSRSGPPLLPWLTAASICTPQWCLGCHMATLA